MSLARVAVITLLSVDPRMALEADGHENASENDRKLEPKNPRKTRPANMLAFFWLLMLYYKHSRLNGWGCPFGSVRHVTHDSILGVTKRNWEEGSWVTQSTWKRKLKGKVAY